jgi:hypothetical protein
MSCVVVVAPVVIAGWPIITAAVTAAVASMGFNIVSSAASSVQARGSVAADVKNKVDIDVEDSEILKGSAVNESMVVEKNGIRAIFSRDARGALKLCVEGESHSKSELKRVGQELIDRVTQQYVYHRVVTELKQRNMSIVDEEVTADRTVKIRVRNI